ncbi:MULTISPECIES: DUF1471 domain-containing protein [Enterobacteriaceae]|uniref:DUF1471 domain-containing protein n=1 Tax=Enterobacteriaceae TaxID=543 RepID=UPI00092D5E90|nr:MULTISPECIES: DUF1471 domain-containing protein [Enterobacteriaceae]EKS6729925.1 DUF1471 domain-containing protein [Enterobacter mori]EES0030187.1 DUF1471 domain-containing protein [Escherichia coli]MBX8911105.1 DUF1471 domain-containing protein [Enterobacter ludwigii]MCD9354852.1 DUF1471 domain-containing protein [Klebsiella pneumoniae]MCD9375874.1 DUF1471 domain-containing protein [Klebsiella pneumoniae]
MKKCLVLSLILSAINCYASTEATYKNPAPSSSVRIGSVSFFNSGSVTQSEIVNELSRKSDELGGSYFVITSLDVDNNSRATAVVYK